MSLENLIEFIQFLTAMNADFTISGHFIEVCVHKPNGEVDAFVFDCDLRCI